MSTALAVAGAVVFWCLVGRSDTEIGTFVKVVALVAPARIFLRTLVLDVPMVEA